MKASCRLLAVLVLVLSFSAVFAPAARAQSGTISPAEFRAKYTAYMAWLDRTTAPALHSRGGCGWRRKWPP